MLNELNNADADEDNDNEEDDDAYDSPVFGSALTPPDSPPFQASIVFQFHVNFIPLLTILK